jgi:hypothetical protein
MRNPEDMKPADYFDRICGTSTGRLIAILLGRLSFVWKMLSACDLTKKMLER